MTDADMWEHLSPMGSLFMPLWTISLEWLQNMCSWESALPWRGTFFFLFYWTFQPPACLRRADKSLVQMQRGFFSPAFGISFVFVLFVTTSFLAKDVFVIFFFFFSNQMLIVLKWLENDFWSQDFNGLCHEYTVTKHNVHSLYKRVQERVLILFFKSLINWGLHLLERQMFCTDFNHEYAIKILSLDNKVLWVVICAIDHIKNWSKAVILCDVRMPFS